MTMLYTKAGILYTPLSMDELQQFVDRPVPWSFCQTAPDEQDGDEDIWQSRVDWKANHTAVCGLFNEYWPVELEAGMLNPSDYGPLVLRSDIEEKLKELLWDRFKQMWPTYPPKPDPKHVVDKWADARTTDALSGMALVYQTPEQRKLDGERMRELLATRGRRTPDSIVNVLELVNDPELLEDVKAVARAKFPPFVFGEGQTPSPAPLAALRAPEPEPAQAPAPLPRLEDPALALPALPEPLPTEPQATPPVTEDFEARTIGEGEKKFTGHPISLDFKDGDLQDIFRLFHDISGLNIVVNPGVTGKVTLSLTEVPWDQALDLILKTNNLGYTQEGNVIRIAKLTDLQREEQERRKLAEEKALAGDLQVWQKSLSYSRADELEPTV